MKNLFEKIDKFARAEIERTGLPQMCNYEVANKKAEELAQALGADALIAKCGTALMDIKFGEATKLGCPNKHVEMSANYAEQILKELNADAETTKKLLNCVLAHHGQMPYESVEAEICANADAYRFISHTGVFVSYFFAKSQGKTHNEALDFVQFKLDEKFNILSLSVAKAELTDLYHELKDFIKKAYI